MNASPPRETGSEIAKVHLAVVESEVRRVCNSERQRDIKALSWITVQSTDQ
jgi:hypothetical protein